MNQLKYFVEGLPGVLGNKRTLAKYRREQGNIGKMSKETKEHDPIFRQQGNKTWQIRGRNIASKFIKRRTNKENV